MKIQKHYAAMSEAIREGAKLGPQAFGTWRIDNRTCVMGAASEAVFGPHLENGVSLVDLWPYIGKNSARCPECKDEDYLSCVMVHLNDEHRWTREQIADWLYAEEEKLGFITLTEANKK